VTGSLEEREHTDRDNQDRPKEALGGAPQSNVASHCEELIINSFRFLG